MNTRQNKWTKSGDFIQSNPHNGPRHEVSYLSTTPNFSISKIRIIGYDDGKIGFDIHADVKNHRLFFSQKFKPLESYFFMLIFNHCITLDPIDDKVALHQAFQIINEIADLKEHQNEIQSILGITNIEQNVCLPSNENQETFTIDTESVQIKNQLYSDKGYRYGTFDLRIARPSVPSVIARPLFSITQDNGKELYMGIPPKMIADIIKLIKEKDTQSLIMKFKESAKGWDIGIALQKGIISDPIKEDLVDSENTRSPQFTFRRY